MHYAANGNFDSNGYLLRQYGFNLADVSSAGSLSGMQSDVQALVYLGLTETVGGVTYSCPGADAAFQNLVAPFLGHDSQIYGFYITDEPSATGTATGGLQCPPANLAAESDYLHAHFPGKRTFIVLDNEGSSHAPSYVTTENAQCTGNHAPYQCYSGSGTGSCNGFTAANSHVDLFGIDPYPCRTCLNGCDISGILTSNYNAAITAGFTQANLVPVFQAFGLGSFFPYTSTCDGNQGTSQYAVPTVAQEQAILSQWHSLLPNPAFDYVYSWGTQSGDTSLSSMTAQQAVFTNHNTGGTP